MVLLMASRKQSHDCFPDEAHSIISNIFVEEDSIRVLISDVDIIREIFEDASFRKALLRVSGGAISFRRTKVDNKHSYKINVNSNFINPSSKISIENVREMADAICKKIKQSSTHTQRLCRSKRPLEEVSYYLTSCVLF